MPERVIGIDADESDHGRSSIVDGRPYRASIGKFNGQGGA